MVNRNLHNCRSTCRANENDNKQGTDTACSVSISKTCEESKCLQPRPFAWANQSSEQQTENDTRRKATSALMILQTRYFCTLTCRLDQKFAFAGDFGANFSPSSSCHVRFSGRFVGAIKPTNSMPNLSLFVAFVSKPAHFDTVLKGWPAKLSAFSEVLWC